MEVAIKPNGERNWRQIGDLSLALALSALTGREREIQRKDAGKRTFILVGLGARRHSRGSSRCDDRGHTIDADSSAFEYSEP
jgi:uncharacterized membrane protein YhiD involved in acid resistance